MPMKDHKIISAFAECERLLQEAGFPPVETEANVGERGCWCAQQGPIFVREGRREKAMRWLGFCQGVVFTLRLATIDDLKRMSMPDPGEGGGLIP